MGLLRDEWENWGKDSLKFGTEFAYEVKKPEGFPSLKDFSAGYNITKTYLQSRHYDRKAKKEEKEQLKQEQQEIIENLHEIQQEHILIKEELSQTQTEYNYNDNIRNADNFDREADYIHNDLQKIKDPKGSKYFETKHHISPENAHTKIKELHEKSAETRENLKPVEQKIQSLQKSQKENEQKYKNQLSQISDRRDKFDIMNKLEQSRKDENISPRDIAELKAAERKFWGLEYERTYGTNKDNHDRFY